MSLPDEFADVFAGVQDVPDPTAAATLTDVEKPLIPEPRAESRDIRVAQELLDPPPAEMHMGPEATDLPPLPRPDLPDLGEGAPLGESRDLRLLAEVQVELAVELGRVKLPLRDLLSLAPGAVLELDRSADAPVDVLVNGCLVARGEVVVIDGEFGVRITAVVER